jgi:hypothetical protein
MRSFRHADDGTCRPEPSASADRQVLRIPEPDLPRVSRRWAQKCEIQIEQATSTTQGLKFKGPGDLIGYESTLEAAVRKNYAMSTEEEQTFEEEIEFTVPPRTMIELRLRWKRFWQEGYIVLANRAGQTINIPFRSVMGITFDQESVDA